MFIQFYRHINYKSYRLWYIKLIKYIFVSKKLRNLTFYRPEYQTYRPELTISGPYLNFLEPGSYICLCCVELKGQLHSNYVFLYFAIIGLIGFYNPIYKNDFCSFQNLLFNIICTSYMWPFIH